MTFLGFASGGFDPILRDRLGLVVWAVILLAAVAGVLGLGRLPRAARVALIALSAFALWTGLSMIWSESAARSADELARVSTYLGILILAMAVSRRGRLELTLAGVAAAIGVIAAAALLSRLQPGLFPADETAEIIEAARARLNYPLNYWNGLAALIAIGAPLLVHFATFARSAIPRALATASIPVLALVVHLTLSRGGALAALAGLAALIAVHPRRLALLPQLAIGALAAGALIIAAESREAFTGGIEGSPQGDEMTLFVVIACALSGLARLGVSATLDRYPLPIAPWLPPTRRTKVALAVGAVIVVVGAGLAAGVPGELSNKWDHFKDPQVSQNSGRLGDTSGNGRYQYWDAAVQAYDSAPILGIGAGAYRFWWTREGSIPGEVVDAHSLYLESLGELGIVGFALIVGFVGGALAAMCAAAVISTRRRRRELAAAFAAAFAFAVGAGLDWSWELPVLPVAFLIVAGAVLARPEGSRVLDDPGARRARRGIIAASLLAALVIVPPMLGATALRDGRERVAAGDLTGALNDADWGVRVEPYSGTAALQKALVLEQIGRITDGSVDAEEATEKEPTNWQAWLALSRMQNELSDFTKSARSYAEAKSLNPNSTLFEKIAAGRREG